jgi:RND family efflux transporter MFP subunit
MDARAAATVGADGAARVRRTAVPWVAGVLIGAALLLAALAVWRLAGGTRTAGATAPPEALPVPIVPVQVRAMPVVLQATGFVVSEHTVQVRPQISGLLKQVFFTEGDSVRLGQRLFLIDPAPFQAELDAARAARDSTRANLERLEGLLQGNYVTPQEFINARASAAQADAAYRRAAINLSYTDVRAGVAGRSGGLTMRAGNLVAPTDGAPLVTINQTRPIEVQFNLAQQFLPRLRAAQARGALGVVVLREEGAGELDHGTVVFMDNAVNASTGTLALKARVPNEHEQLWPGQFVSVRVQLAIEPHASIVPETAVQTGPAGNYVYVVAAGRALKRAVDVDRHQDDLAVIARGVEDGDRVVERVPSNLRPGMAVKESAPSRPPRARVGPSGPT